MLLENKIFIFLTNHAILPFCSFVSLIHLLVGVVYCLVGWSVGLPKRAVSYILCNFLFHPFFIQFEMRLTLVSFLFDKSSPSVRNFCLFWLQLHSVMLLDMSCPMYHLQLLPCLSHIPSKVSHLIAYQFIWCFSA